MSVWRLAGLLGWLAPIFGGVWYVITKRKAGPMPSQMDGIANGAILGGVVGFVFGLAAHISGSLSTHGSAAMMGLGFGNVVVRLIVGVVGGAVGSFGYLYLVQ